MPRDAYTVVKKPRITEKATALQENEKAPAYTFEVARDANKVEIKLAVEKLFKVKVAKVRTAMVKGKWKRVRMNWGKASDWKKAIVTLKAGQRIDVM